MRFHLKYQDQDKLHCHPQRVKIIEFTFHKYSVKNFDEIIYNIAKAFSNSHKCNAINGH